MKKILLLLLLPSLLFAAYLNINGATDSSFGSLPYNADLQHDTMTTWFACGWFQTNATTGPNIFGGWDTTTVNRGINIDVRASGVMEYYARTDGSDYQRTFTVATYNDNKPHFFILYHIGNIGGNAKDTAGVFFYMDGSTVVSAVTRELTGALGTLTNSDPLGIGAKGVAKKTTYQGYFPGKLWGLAMCKNLKPTSRIIQELYNGGTYCPQLYANVGFYRGSPYSAHHWPMAEYTNGAQCYTFKDVCGGLDISTYTVKSQTVPTLYPSTITGYSIKMMSVGWQGQEE